MKTKEKCKCPLCNPKTEIKDGHIYYCKTVKGTFGSYTL